MNSVKALRVIGLVVASFAWQAPGASPAAEASARLLAQAGPRIKAIYETNEFRMPSLGATWLPDGSGDLKVETPDGAAGAEIARYDTASGQRTVVVASGKLLVPATSPCPGTRGGIRAPSGNRFLLSTDLTSGGRGSNHWLYEPVSGSLRPVDAGRGARFESNAFSPDGQQLLGSRGADLIVFDLASGQVLPLTKNGDPGTIGFHSRPQQPATQTKWRPPS